MDIQGITDIENQYCGQSGAPVLGRAFAELHARWEAGQRDRETCLRLLFLAWYTCSEPPWLTGLPETDDTPQVFRSVFAYLEENLPGDAEFLFVAGYMAASWPLCCGTESEWEKKGQECLVRFRETGEDLLPEVFSERGAYGEYFSHVLSDEWIEEHIETTIRGEQTLSQYPVKPWDYIWVPIRILAWVFIGIGVYLWNKESIEIGAVKLYGLAKYVWALSIEVTYCLGFLSLLLLICIGLLVKEAKFRFHPWKPVAISIVLLIICLVLFWAGMTLESYVLASVREINVLFDIEENKSYRFVTSALWFIVAYWFALFGALILPGLLLRLIKVRSASKLAPPVAAPQRRYTKTLGMTGIDLEKFGFVPHAERTRRWYEELQGESLTCECEDCRNLVAARRLPWFEPVANLLRSVGADPEKDSNCSCEDPGFRGPSWYQLDYSLLGELRYPKPKPQSAGEGLQYLVAEIPFSGGKGSYIHLTLRLHVPWVLPQDGQSGESHD